MNSESHHLKHTFFGLFTLVVIYRHNSNLESNLPTSPLFYSRLSCKISTAACHIFLPTYFLISPSSTFLFIHKSSMRPIAHACWHHISMENDKINRNKYMKKNRWKENFLFAKDSCITFSEWNHFLICIKCKCLRMQCIYRMQTRLRDERVENVSIWASCGVSKRGKMVKFSLDWGMYGLRTVLNFLKGKYSRVRISN